MKRQYWAKVWIEMLDDEKVAAMPDRLWRRWVELLMIAKTVGSDGRLPELGRMAWRLRMTPELLESDLVELGRVGVIAQRDGAWNIPKFAERQAARSGAERMRTHRRYGPSDTRVTPESQSARPASVSTLSTTELSTTEDSEDRVAERPKPPEYPAVLVFREQAHLWPAKTWRSEIVSTVGDEPASLERWGNLIHEWVGRGWKPTNVSGMLEAFRAGGIKDRRNGRADPIQALREKSDG